MDVHLEGGELVVTFCINYNFEMTSILTFPGIGTSSLQRLNCRSEVEVTQNPSPPFRLSLILPEDLFDIQ